VSYVVNYAEGWMILVHESNLQISQNWDCKLRSGEPLMWSSFSFNIQPEKYVFIQIRDLFSTFSSPNQKTVLILPRQMAPTFQQISNDILITFQSINEN
jgi:hypothetical protein